MKDFTATPPHYLLNLIMSSAAICLSLAALIWQIRLSRKMHEHHRSLEEKNALIPVSCGNQAKGHNLNADTTFTERLEAVMEKHVSDENFNVGVITTELGMSRTSLFSKMKGVYGVSPQTWITNYRLNLSIELLKSKKHSVSEVSEMVGFTTVTGFSRSFKNKFGIPPSSITKSKE